MKTTNWTKVLIISSIGLLTLALVLNLFAPLLWRQFGGWGYDNCFGCGDWSMMRGGGGPGMMGYHPFWGSGMLIGWLFPLGLVALLIAGIAWLVQAIGRSSAPLTPPPPSRACPQCGQPAQANWRNCPYCGTPLVEV
ncbi:MAG TPA: zinc ribbon domain-containing protein [Anaerolineae bacterium]|jgi:hypothetical protein